MGSSGCARESLGKSLKNRWRCAGAISRDSKRLLHTRLLCFSAIPTSGIPSYILMDSCGSYRQGFFGCGSRAGKSPDENNLTLLWCLLHTRSSALAIFLPIGMCGIVLLRSLLILLLTLSIAYGLLFSTYIFRDIWSLRRFSFMPSITSALSLSTTGYIA